VVAILGWVVAVLQGLAATAAIVLWHAVDGRRRRGARRLAPLLSLIVVRPIRGLDPGLAQNVRAALAQRYPGALETIFVLDDTSDPAYPVVRRLVDAAWARARVVIAGPLPRGRTGKLHTMIEGLRAARLDARLVGFADSDTRPAPTLLAELARAVVAQADVGAAFAPAVTVSRPRTVGDIGYGLLLDGIYDPLAALAMTQARSLPFIIGQTMVLRRRALVRAGALRPYRRVVRAAPHARPRRPATRRAAADDSGSLRRARSPMILDHIHGHRGTTSRSGT
jgi:ceramide glucosyltransferase